MGENLLFVFSNIKLFLLYCASSMTSWKLSTTCSNCIHRFQSAYHDILRKQIELGHHFGHVFISFMVLLNFSLLVPSCIADTWSSLVWHDWLPFGYHQATKQPNHASVSLINLGLTDESHFYWLNQGCNRSIATANHPDAMCWTLQE